MSSCFVIFAVLLFLFSLFMEIAMQRLWTAKMHKMKIEQVTKKYGPCWHEKTKMGTPTMGGIVFIPVMLVSSVLICFVYGLDNWSTAMQVISYPILAAAVGFVDDWLKYTKHSSDGLKSLQKLLLQVIVTVAWASWVLPDSLYIMPSFAISKIYALLLVSFIGVGFQNAVNVTDGLDGLAAGCSLISLIGALFFLPYSPLLALVTISGCGIALGFLWHNANPASVFMGDVGAHFFAGLLLSVSLASGAFIFILPLGFMFGIEIISVSVQIFAIRRLKRKVFLMSPIHHHFEMLGWKETQIVFRFLIIHTVGMVVFGALFSVFSNTI